MRNNTSQKLLTLGQDRRRSADRRKATFDYPSAFVTQILNTRSTEPLTFKPTRNAAVETYARNGEIAVRRAPAGLAHQSEI